MYIWLHTLKHNIEIKMVNIFENMMNYHNKTINFMFITCFIFYPESIYQDFLLSFKIYA